MVNRAYSVFVFVFLDSYIRSFCNESFLVMQYFNVKLSCLTEYLITAYRKSVCVGV